MVAEGRGGIGSLGLAEANLYTARINKVPPPSTGSHSRHPVITRNGKEYEKECIRMYN